LRQRRHELSRGEAKRAKDGEVWLHLRRLSMTPMEHKTLVVAPRYNEWETLPNIVNTVAAQPLRLGLLLVDDNHPTAPATAMEGAG
jgi:hypothetical protein